MSRWLRLAVKNLTRNTRRTVLSLGAIIAGVAVLIVGRGFLAGLSDNLIRSQIDTVSGHVLARPADYPDEPLAHPVTGAFTLTDAQRAWLDEHTTAWTRRLVFAPTAVHRADGLRVRALGFDPGRDAAVFPRDAWKTTGVLGTTAEQGVTVSGGVARLLDLDVGDALTLQVRTRAGALNALQVPVAGLYSASNPYLDRFGILVPLPLAEELVQAEGYTTHLATRLGDDRPETAAAFAPRLAEQLGEGVEAVTWRTEVEPMLALQRVRQRALDLLVFALLAMSATGIANTILMAAYERTREIGTLRAMGMTRRGVLGMFLLEGALLGTVGGLLGTALGAAIVGWYATHGIDLSEPLERGAGGHIPVSTVLYLAQDVRWLVLAPLFGLGVSVLASIYPARVASRMSPADAVRAP